MLSEKARSLLRDFMLVFDLDEFFKGSTEVTDSDAAKTLEYIKSVFEQANLLAPTTYMTPAGLLKHLKSLRNTNQILRRMRRQLSAYSGCCQFGTPKRPRKSDLAGERLRRAGALRRRMRRAFGPQVRGYISGVSGPSSSPENLRLGTIKSQKITGQVSRGPGSSDHLPVGSEAYGCS